MRSVIGVMGGVLKTQQEIEKGKQDRQILLKYAEGCAVEAADMETLREYGGLGIVHIGFSFSKKESQAKLTESGRRILGLEG